MRFTKILFPISILLALSISSCTLMVNDNQSTEVDSFQRYMMTTFDNVSGSHLNSGRALTPFNPVESSGARATVPMFGATTITFPGQHGAGSTVTGSQTNYPEPGQTSSWTVVLYNAPNNVYRVDVTTTFPSYDLRNTQVESYLVKDITSNIDATPNGYWTNADYLVNNLWVGNGAYRLQNRLTYRDGSYQDEIITTVKNPVAGDNSSYGYAAFDINGTLDYPNVFSPVVDQNLLPSSATYSSVVAYTRVFTNSPTFSFWSGNVANAIVGIRYYTEHNLSATQLQADMVVFEKAVTAYTTLSGNFVDAASSLFLPNLANNPNPTLLSQSFLRQRIVYGRNADTTINYGSAARDTRIKTLVVDISTQKDFYITKVNSEANTLTTTTIDPLTTTLFIPSGDATEVLAADNTLIADIKLKNQTIKTGDAAPVDITTINPTGDLGILWKSVTEGVQIPGITNDIPLDLSGVGDVKSFNGLQGITVAGAPGLYDYPLQGSVQAWVYINAQSDTAGIVHAGYKADFTDEIWSLQFMGANGQVAFSLSTQTPYKYDWVGAKVNLAIKKWYYIVATWDVAGNSMKLYLNGVLNNSGKFTNCKISSTYASNVPIIIGSQFYDATKVLSGYYGFNGKINGVLIQNTVMNATAVSTQYNANKANTTGW